MASTIHQTWLKSFRFFNSRNSVVGNKQKGKRGSESHSCKLTIGFDQHLLLAHVLYVDGAVDDELRRGAVILLHLLALVALDLKGISCAEQKGKEMDTRDNQPILHCLRQDCGSNCDTSVVCQNFTELKHKWLFCAKITAERFMFAGHHVYMHVLEMLVRGIWVVLGAFTNMEDLPTSRNNKTF